MTNIIKRIVKTPKDLLLRDVRSSLEDIKTVLNDIRAAQLTINHKQHLQLEEIEKKVKNAGTLVLSDKEIVTKIFSGLKMYLDPRDMVIAPHIALDGIWEHRITIAWLATLRPTDTVLDIGANSGYYGVLAAQKTDKKRSKIILFEANPHLIPYIRKTLAANWLNEQTVIENVAVADKPGKLTLNILKDYVGSSSVHSDAHVDKYMHGKMYIEATERVSVPATTIDDYCKTHHIKTVDLIKMDIEGFEDKAYQGMRGIIKASPSPTLFIEFTKDAYDNPKEFYDQMLEDFGHVYMLDDEGYITQPPDPSYDAVIGESDDWVMPIFSKNSKLANR